MVRAWLRRLARPSPAAATPAPAETAPTATTATAEPPAEPREADISADKVAQRAYEKWVARGRPGGTAAQDWLEAEAELRAEHRGRRPEPLPRHPR